MMPLLFSRENVKFTVARAIRPIVTFRLAESTLAFNFTLTFFSLPP